MRDSNIDLLRFIGLAMIILAHVGPPDILFQLRNFDVPLMVLVSGMAFAMSYRAGESYTHYLWKRVKRLVFPVWIFLTAYFGIQYLFLAPGEGFNTELVVDSYLMIGGIGYVWIIRVFLLVALVSPFILRWSQKESSHLKYFLLLITVSAIYEVARYVSIPHIHEGVLRIASLTLYYLIPYAIIFAIGVRLSSLEDKQVLGIVLLSFAALMFFLGAIYVLTGTVSATQYYKYPPSFYYFSYALMVSALLWLLRRQIAALVEKAKLKGLVSFCASNSIWIYLWHIPFVEALQGSYIINYLVVFSVSVIVTYLQFRLVEYVVQRTQNVTLKQNIKAFFIG